MKLHIHALAGTLAAALLAGCAGGPRGEAPSTTPSAPVFGGLFGYGLSPALEAQRSRLATALKGTPVVIEATGDKRLRIEVPMKFAFDAGRSAVKPALGAVLDQFATGFKPHAAVTELRIAAPADDQAGTRLVHERAASVRDYLVARGVPISRIVELGKSGNGGVEIAVNDRPVNKP